MVNGSIQRDGDDCASASATATARESVPVRYSGVVPDPFREGREVIVSGELAGGTFVAERDSLITKCPSKFTKDEEPDVADVGSACLFVGLFTALYAVGASLYGAPRGTTRVRDLGPAGHLLPGGPDGRAIAILESAFLRSDFSYALVAEGSSTDTPTFYKVTAMWATQDGSLLLWALLLPLFSSAVLFLTRHSLREIAPYATAVLGVAAGFFLSADGGLGEPVRHPREPAGGGRRA